MGKRGRRRQRESRSPAQHGLHVTVTALTALGELDLRHETQLVKAAVLYADRVTLASPKAVLLASWPHSTPLTAGHAWTASRHS
jgi:hypothetical protein